MELTKKLTEILNELDMSKIDASEVIHFVEQAIEFSDDSLDIEEQKRVVIEDAKSFIQQKTQTKIKRKTRIAIAPNPGPQELLVNCPYSDILYGGALGGGKSMGIILRIIYIYNICQQINKAREEAGFKKSKGTFLVIRKELGGLDDLIAESNEIFCNIMGAVYTRHLYTFPDGFQVRFGFIDGNQKSFNKYQGKKYIGIYIDEAGQYSREEFENIKLLKSRMRNTAGFPSDFVMTANPGGPGHNLLKQQYNIVNNKKPVVSQTYKGDIIDEKHPKYNTDEVSYRVFIPARLEDNPYLINSGYKESLESLGFSKSQIDNLLEGNWNIESEGMFDDIFNENIHVLDVRDVIIPNTWHFSRGYDYGTSSPYASLIFAENTGRGDLIIGGKKYSTPIGTKIIVDEDYGGGRKNPNKPHEGDGSYEEEHAQRLLKLEEDIKGRYLVNNINQGYADSSIFDGPPGVRGIDKFRNVGLDFLPSIKGQGSRAAGWSHIRRLLDNVVNNNMNEPHLYIMSTCEHTIRCFLNLQKDTKRMNGDLKERSEDHIHDVIRYNTYKPVIKQKRKTLINK